MRRIAALGRRPDVTTAVEDLGEEARRGLTTLARLLLWDEELLLKARRLQRPSRTRAARLLTRAGDGSSWTLYGLLMLATFQPALVHAALRMAAAAGVATVLSQLLKRSLGRARPDRAIVGFEALSGNPDRFSFPSGHTAAAFAVAVAFAFAGAPFGIGAALFVLALGIAVSRVYLGAHYPLDVAAGAVLGTFAGVAARFLVAF